MIKSSKMRILLIFSIASIIGMPLFAQSAHSNLKDTELLKKFRFISEEIMCVCGCNDPLEYCNHHQCIAWGIRDVIDKNLEAGRSADFIISGHINGYGDIVDTDPAFEIIRVKYPEYLEKMRKGFGEKFRSYPAKHNPEIIILVIIFIFGGIAAIFIKGKLKKLKTSDPNKPVKKEIDSEKEKLYKDLYK